ncbi:FAD/NAD(P)-binding protein [Pseudomonas sp. MSSRFD41]|uniref:FAD/NAD(P)-binding protein n=1 Tax=Pseudomonas sp. MSSRFD41 TaxID=1310370 RepID=UPI00163A386C|nr:FAD/NAD(P)-binding protein [Pseudomonas sp. MSSRFD41]MBC2655648.1 FAD/NAD(P)-binding protein [Pseudomonas sp. MSSRFD41]
MTDDSTPILIIGGGFSGTLTAIHLLRTTTGQAASITLLDPAAVPGRGLAYRGNDDNLLLNVPAGNMSAFADDPSHFVEFCQQIDPSFNVGSFVSRRLYGRYLQLNLQRAMAANPGRLRLVQDQAHAVHSRPGKDGFTVTLASGRLLAAQHVVLALGHQVPGFPLPLPPKELEKVIEPWDFQRMSQLPGDAPVLILGTGHTAVDALFQLTQQARPRRIWMLSRHGLLPHAHRLNPVPPATSQYPTYLGEAPLRVRTLLRELRKEIARKALAGCDWRDVLNQLRPHTPRLWQAMPLVERQRFLRHGMAFWDIHRHRLAPLSADRLQALKESDEVQVLGGRLTNMRATSRGMLQVQFRPRCQPREQSLEVAAIINCTGPRMSIGSHSSPLLQQLARDGLLVPDPNKLGVLIDDHYQPTCSSGQATPGLWYVGPMLKAQHWEAIAVPELRGHTQRLAQHLARQLAIYPVLPTQAELA